MTKRKDIQNESLAEIAIDPDVLAQELSVELEIDPLEQIDKDGFSRGTLNKNLECDEALKLLKGDREQRIQGLRVFCDYRDKRSFPLLLPLLEQPCPVERMSAVYALGRNPFPSAVKKLVNLLETDDNAYVRRATAWSLANYDNEIVLKPLINSLKNDVASVRLWSSSSLAEIGSTSSFNAQLAAEQLLISLKIDNEPVVRSNCIWSLCRLFEKLVSLLETDDNAYVRRATAWSLANYDNEIVLKPLINSLKNDVASVRLWSSSSLAEIGSTSSFNAQLAAEQLLISLKIDNEPVVRSNCIWSLCRLFEKLNEISQESFVDECTKIALFDKEPSVMEEAKTALDSMGMKGFYK